MIILEVMSQFGNRKALKRFNFVNIIIACSQLYAYLSIV